MCSVAVITILLFCLVGQWLIVCYFVWWGNDYGFVIVFGEAVFTGLLLSVLWNSDY